MNKRTLEICIDALMFRQAWIKKDDQYKAELEEVETALSELREMRRAECQREWEELKAMKELEGKG